MSDPADAWIVVNGWDKFQHYKGRRPLWIKAYTDLLDRHEYRQLSGHRRGLLHGIWMLYAASGAELPASPAELSRRLGLPTEHEERMARRGRDGGETRATFSAADEKRPVRDRDLKALEQAGFLTISASKPLADASRDASLEGEREKKRLTQPSAGTPKSPEPAKPTPIKPAPSLLACPICGLRTGLTSSARVRDHLDGAHWIEGDEADKLMRPLESGPSS